MKRLIIILLGLTPVLSFGQALEKQFVLVAEYQGFSQVNDSTFRGDINFPVDQLGEGYLPTQIQVGYFALDATRRKYRVQVVNSTTFTTANLDLVEIVDNNIAPVGVGEIYQAFSNSLAVPPPPANSIGISDAFLSGISIHNVEAVGNASVNIDSTRLVQDSILVYYLNGVETGRDTITGTGGGGSDGNGIISALPTGDVTIDALGNDLVINNAGTIQFGDAGSQRIAQQPSSTIIEQAGDIIVLGDPNDNANGTKLLIDDNTGGLPAYPGQQPTQTVRIVFGDSLGLSMSEVLAKLDSDTFDVSGVEEFTGWPFAEALDSTRLIQDSILVYYQNGVEIGRDTITGTGGGGSGGSLWTAVDDDIIYNTGVVGIGLIDTLVELNIEATNEDGNKGININSPNGDNGSTRYGIKINKPTGGANTTFYGVHVSVLGGTTNYGLYIENGLSYLGGTLDMNFNSIINVGNTKFIDEFDTKFGHILISDENSIIEGTGGSVVFGMNQVGQSGYRAPTAMIRGEKENSTYNNALGALVFYTANGTGGVQPLLSAALTEAARISSDGFFGISDPTPDYILDIEDTGAILLPLGTTAQRPGIEVEGLVRGNSSTKRLEYRTDTGFDQIAFTSDLFKSYAEAYQTSSKRDTFYLSHPKAMSGFSLGESNNYSLTDSLLTHIGTDTHKFKIEYSADVQFITGTANTDQLTFIVQKNGSGQGKCQTTSHIINSGGNARQRIAGSCFLSLANNDNIKVVITSSTNVGGIDAGLYSRNILITQID